MSFIAAETIKQVIGSSLPAGLPGWDMQYDVNAGATLEGGPSASIPVELNQPSFDRATQKNDNALAGAFNVPAAQAAAFAATAHGNANNARYESLFAKRGLNKAINNVGMMRPAGRPYRHDMRSALAKQPEPANPKNVVQRVVKRRHLELRKTFDEILKRKQVSLNPEMLPDSTKQQLRQQELQKGVTHSVLPRLQPQAKPQPKKRRNWALFYNPELIPSGWATH